jgi:hypothetical protein
LFFDLLWFERLFRKGFQLTFPEIVWAVYGFFLIAVFVRICIKPAYLHVENGFLKVNHDFFYTDTIPISSIDKMELESSPFSRSKIFLKEKLPSVEFSYYDLNDEDFKKFKNSVPFPIE